MELHLYHTGCMCSCSCSCICMCSYVRFPAGSPGPPGSVLRRCRRLEKVEEGWRKVREGQRRLEEASRKYEKVRESMRKCEKVQELVLFPMNLYNSLGIGASFYEKVLSRVDLPMLRAVLRLSPWLGLRLRRDAPTLPGARY